jgi:hypothetical protein
MWFSPLRGLRHRAKRISAGNRPTVPTILLPLKITVKGALSRVGASHRRPLSSDLARQTLGTYQVERCRLGAGVK